MIVWRFGDTVGLVARAWLWLAGVTVPLVSLSFVCWWVTASVVAYDWSGGLGDELSAVYWLFLFDAVTAVVALGGAVVSLPFTHALGVLMAGVRSHGLQVVATTVLAGGLGSGTAWAAGEAWAPHSGPFFAVFVGATAAGAGALARWGQLRSAARTASSVRRAEAVWP
ncbi:MULTISPECIES: hypothetical protein [Curtobacterium]|uniref:hypothetical protein n=1 Tax=Curtobacterium flaccumfaciens TaxID=2035 RepID=UPI003EE77958